LFTVTDGGDRLKETAPLVVNRHPKLTHMVDTMRIVVQTVGDFLVDIRKHSTETPEGIWYTWRKVNSGAVSGGISVGFFSLMMGAPAETGEELNCLFDRNTGRLSNYNYREW